MKTTFFTFLALAFGLIGFAQYGRIEINTGGFSPVPAFSDSQPNLVFAAGTNTEKKLSAHLIGNIRVEGKYLRSAIFMTQYQIIDKRFKLSIATHLPVIQVQEDFHADSFFAQDIRTSFEINENSSIGLQYVHGKGLNNDIEIHLVSLSHNLRSGKFNFHTQLYRVDIENTWGLAERINYQLSDRFYLAGFYNKGIGGSADISTLGLGFHL